MLRGHRLDWCEQADGYSGADLAALLREAGLDVLRELKSLEAVQGSRIYGERGMLLELIPATRA